MPGSPGWFVYYAWSQFTKLSCALRSKSRTNKQCKCRSPVLMVHLGSRDAWWNGLTERWALTCSLNNMMEKKNYMPPWPSILSWGKFKTSCWICKLCSFLSIETIIINLCLDTGRYGEASLATEDRWRYGCFDHEYALLARCKSGVLLYNR